MKYDLHVHIKDYDRELTKLNLLKIVNDLKLECISFTDHNMFCNSTKEQLKELYRKKYNSSKNVKLIDGIEQISIETSTKDRIIHLMPKSSS